MNTFAGIGRLVREPDIKETQKGKKFAKFTIAINKFNDEVNFIDCIIFNENLVSVVERFTNKGSQVGVTGSLDINTYEKDGHKFKQPQINVVTVDLLDSKKESNKSEPNPFVNNSVDVSDDDLPFD